MIRMAICDDDSKFVKTKLCSYIQSAAQETGSQVVLSCFSDGKALLDSIDTDSFYDIIVLDIEMPEVNGKQLAKKLRSLDNSFFLIFVSAYPEQVFDTLKYKVNAFIPKNRSKDIYMSEFVRVFKEYAEYALQFDLIEILKEGRLSHLKISHDNILAFFLKDHIIYLKTPSADYILKETIFKKISEKYLSQGFFESSRNCLVNVKRIVELRASSLTLSNGDTLPVSRRSYRPLLSVFSMNMMSEIEQ